MLSGERRIGGESRAGEWTLKVTSTNREREKRNKWTRPVMERVLDPGMCSIFESCLRAWNGCSGIKKT